MLKLFRFRCAVSYTAIEQFELRESFPISICNMAENNDGFVKKNAFITEITQKHLEMMIQVIIIKYFEFQCLDNLPSYFLTNCAGD